MFKCLWKFVCLCVCCLFSSKVEPRHQTCAFRIPAATHTKRNNHIAHEMVSKKLALDFLGFCHFGFAAFFLWISKIDKGSDLNGTTPKLKEKILGSVWSCETKITTWTIRNEPSNYIENKMLVDFKFTCLSWVLIWKRATGRGSWVASNRKDSKLKLKEWIADSA